MKRNQFTIKPIESGYGIFYRHTPNYPLQKFPDRKSAQRRLTQYLKNVRRNDK